MSTLFPLSTNLSADQKASITSLAKLCRRSIVEMVTNAASGHPGGSCSSIDALAVLYTNFLDWENDKTVISNGHISPAMYSILGHLGVVDIEEVVRTFRKNHSLFEGHVNRSVRGISYGTGPLGIGASVAAGFAWGQRQAVSDKPPLDAGGKLIAVSGKREDGDTSAPLVTRDSLLATPRTYVFIGDGECQEGQVYEMLQFASHQQLKNLIAVVDFNKVQLTASLAEMNNINLPAIFKASGWQVIETDGHDYDKLFAAFTEAQKSTTPVVILAHTIMGRGVVGMEEDGLLHKPTWHGRAPKKEEAEKMVASIGITAEDEEKVKNLRDVFSTLKSNAPVQYDTPNTNLAAPIFHEDFSINSTVDMGTFIEYGPADTIDIRTAYGKALLDLAERNSHVIAISADLSGSVMTKFVAKELPAQHIECGIAEQNMVSVAGGLSLQNFVPFPTTFAVFMTSRAKDQARVNDINRTNVKMVGMYAGLSNAKDGPTHQGIDDSGSMMGLLHTHVVEPHDPNHMDRATRYIAGHYGNFYLRSGRGDHPILVRDDGTPYFDKNYTFEYGKSDLLSSGSDLTILASGPCVAQALQAVRNLQKTDPGFSIELIAVSCPRELDEQIFTSIQKTKQLITVEDHNPVTGMGTQVGAALTERGILVEKWVKLGVNQYQTSGNSPELYNNLSLDAEGIEKTVRSLKR